MNIPQNMLFNDDDNDIIEFFNKNQLITIQSLIRPIINAIKSSTETKTGSDLIMQLFNKINTVSNQIVNVNDTIKNSQIQNIQNMSIKLNELKTDIIELKKEIIEDTKITMSSPSVFQSIIDKTTLLFTQHFPQYQRDITNIIQSEISKINTSQLNTNSLDVLFKNIEKKIETNFNRTDNTVKDIRDATLKSANNAENMTNKVTEIYNKLNNSSNKGKISENILFHQLVEAYPEAEVINCSGIKESGDIIINRKDKPSIMFENKYYVSNVDKDEVTKFIRDATIQNMCAILISQSSGIAHKHNFEIEINNSNILVYIHNANNNINVIKIAINIIDSFKQKYDEFYTNISKTSNVNENTEYISNDILSQINNEYKSFATSQLSIINNIRKNAETTIAEIESISFPSLDKYLSVRYAFPSKTIKKTDKKKVEKTDTIIQCTICNETFFKKNSYSAHYKKHQRDELVKK